MEFYVIDNCLLPSVSVCILCCRSVGSMKNAFSIFEELCFFSSPLAEKSALKE